MSDASWSNAPRNYKYKYSSMVGDFKSAASSQKGIQIIRWTNSSAFIFGIVLLVSTIYNTVAYPHLQSLWVAGIFLSVTVLLTSISGYIASFRDIFHVSQQKAASIIFLVFAWISATMSGGITIGAVAFSPKILEDRTDRLLETKRFMTFMFASTLGLSVFQAFCAGGFIYFQASYWRMERQLGDSSRTPFLRLDGEDGFSEAESTIRVYPPEHSIRRIPYEDTDNEADDTFFQKSRDLR